MAAPLRSHTAMLAVAPIFIVFFLPFPPLFYPSLPLPSFLPFFFFHHSHFEVIGIETI